MGFVGFLEQRRLTGPRVPTTEGTGFTYPRQHFWNYFNLSQPNLIDVPNLPTLVNGFDTMLWCTYIASTHEQPNLT